MCHVGFVRRSRGAESLRIDERDLTGYSIPISQLLNASSSLSDIVVCFSSHISLSLCYLAPSQSQLRPGDTTQALPPFSLTIISREEYRTLFPRRLVSDCAYERYYALSAVGVFGGITTPSGESNT